MRQVSAQPLPSVEWIGFRTRVIPTSAWPSSKPDADEYGSFSWVFQFSSALRSLNQWHRMRCESVPLRHFATSVVLCSVFEVSTLFLLLVWDSFEELSWCRRETSVSIKIANPHLYCLQFHFISSLFVCCMQRQYHGCGNQRTTFQSWFSSAAAWVPVIELGLSDLMATHLPLWTEPSHQPSQAVLNACNLPYCSMRCFTIIILLLSVNNYWGTENLKKLISVSGVVIKKMWIWMLSSNLTLHSWFLGCTIPLGWYSYRTAGVSGV